jgi:hypothetical protein
MVICTDWVRGFVTYANTEEVEDKVGDAENGKLRLMKQTNVAGDWARYAQMTREERLQAFKRCTIEHPHLLVAGQALHDVIQEPGGASLIFVCGPAGVGKTTLKNYVIEATETEMMFASLVDEEHPILTMLARPPLNASFGWRDFLQSGLLAVKQLPDQRMALHESNDEEQTRVDWPKESRTKRRAAEGIKEDDLRLSLEAAIKRCRPVAVIVDDAQHLGKARGGLQLKNQVDCIKSLADVTETIFVLIGTYELLPLRKLSAQLIGRSLDIHFPRYGSTEEELSQFRKVLSTFQAFLPFEAETDILLKHWEYCYERSLGCVGILHHMLVRAIHAALWADEETLSEKYLKRSAFSEAACYEMMHEAYAGEREFAFSYGDTGLRQMLGLKPQVTSKWEITFTPRRSSPLGEKRQALRDHME